MWYSSNHSEHTLLCKQAYNDICRTHHREEVRVNVERWLTFASIVDMDMVCYGYYWHGKDGTLNKQIKTQRKKGIWYLCDSTKPLLNQSEDAGSRFF